MCRFSFVVKMFLGFVLFLNFGLYAQDTVNYDWEPALPEDWTGDVYEPQTLPLIIKEKRECMARISVRISSNDHNCNAAQFILFANKTPLKDLKNNNSLINLNNSNNNSVDSNGNIIKSPDELDPNYPNDIGGYRETNINLNDNLANEVIQTKQDTLVSLYLQCATPPNEDRGWGFGACHEGVPFVEITRLDLYTQESTIVYSNTPIILKQDQGMVKLIDFNPCFEPTK